MEQSSAHYFALSVSKAADYSPLKLINLGVDFSHLLGIIRRGVEVGLGYLDDFCLEDHGRILQFYYHGGATRRDGGSSIF